MIPATCSAYEGNALLLLPLGYDATAPFLRTDWVAFVRYPSDRRSDASKTHRQFSLVNIPHRDFLEGLKQRGGV